MAIPSASFGCITAMLHQTFLFLGQLWQLFEVSQILEFLRYMPKQHLTEILVQSDLKICVSISLCMELKDAIIVSYDWSQYGEKERMLMKSN